MARKSEVSPSRSQAAVPSLITGARKRAKADTRPAAISEPGSARSRQEAIALEAWLRAERRGFAGGDPVADWLEAERAVDARLAAAHGHRTAA
jgi:hypothetical protein